VREAYFEYQQLVRHLSGNTIAAYRRDLQRFDRFLKVRSCGENDMDLRGARQFLSALTKEGLSARSINRALSCLRGYYRFKLKHGYGGINPFRELKSLRTRKALPTFLFEREMDDLLKMCGNRGAGDAADRRDFEDIWTVRDALILEMLYSTGCRVSELVSVRCTDLDLHSGILKVVGKGAKERLVFLGQAARSVLKSYLLLRRAALSRMGETEAQALFLNRRGGRLTARGVQHILLQNLKKSSVDKAVSPHTFRHSFATHILNRGGDIRVVQELLGHASLSTTQVYTHLDLDRLKKVYTRAHPHALKSKAKKKRTVRGNDKRNNDSRRSQSEQFGFGR